MQVQALIMIYMHLTIHPSGSYFVNQDVAMLTLKWAIDKYLEIKLLPLIEDVKPLIVEYWSKVDIFCLSKRNKPQLIEQDYFPPIEKEDLKLLLLEHLQLNNFRSPQSAPTNFILERAVDYYNRKIQISIPSQDNLMTDYLGQYNSVMTMSDLLLEGVSFYTGNSNNNYMGLITSLLNVGLVFNYLHPAFAIIAPINLGVNLYYGTQKISDFSYVATQYIAAGMLKFLGAESIIYLVSSVAITLSVMDKAIKLYDYLISDYDAHDVTMDLTTTPNHCNESYFTEEYGILVGLS